MSRIEIYADKRHQWRWRLNAANGRIVASGEGYTSRRDALRGAHAMTRAAKAALWIVQP